MSDLISRQAAIDRIINLWVEKIFSNPALVEIKDCIETLPSAQPERKKGRWYLEHHVWFCDQCGKNPTKGMGYVQGTDELFDFCPNCGADMRGDKDEV